ncbi:terminase small subunit [Clostridium tertium]|uniref:terminase small subunit n=1 Tax=Clostridium tertium TaxID=1559 RepID=UPI00232BCF5A|nr:terminase small subunit [Clostridium tertium]MDB1956499.1 terminase small subunit [Clostridium tertium]MDB1958800.1 terminase small subunit [Clostridium tertium]MDB1962333.1 terminase small subunit [Clostridium tertium]MDB1967577.1 terminase small subunit [Clostridium tertium]
MTEKQKAFCDYYIETGNATEAAIKAGYSKKTAKVIGSENLTKPYLKQYIDERLAQIEDARIAKGEEVLQYLTKVMRGEEKDQFGLDASLQDRTKAAELLGKRYRLFVDKVEADVNQTVVFTGEDELED